MEISDSEGEQTALTNTAQTLTIENAVSQPTLKQTHPSEQYPQSSSEEDEPLAKTHPLQTPRRGIKRQHSPSPPTLDIKKAKRGPKPKEPSRKSRAVQERVLGSKTFHNIPKGKKDLINASARDNSGTGA
jgi:hypothetical protein